MCMDLYINFVISEMYTRTHTHGLKRVALAVAVAVTWIMTVCVYVA